MPEYLANHIDREHLYRLAHEHIGVNGHLNHWKFITKGLNTSERKAEFAQCFTAYLFKVIDHPVDFIGPTEHHYRIGVRKIDETPSFCEDKAQSDGSRETWYDPEVVSFSDIDDYVEPESIDGYPPMFNSKVYRKERNEAA